MTLLPELAKIVSEYSKPAMPYWREYKKYVTGYGEWSELKEELKAGNEDAASALRGYLAETEPEVGPFDPVVWRKAWWLHDLSKAVYGEDVVWWEFHDYKEWLWVEIMMDQGAGSCFLHPDTDISPFHREFDRPLREGLEAPDWVNEYDPTSPDFTRHYVLGQKRI